MRLIDSYVKGVYSNVPWKTLVTAVVAVVYFVIPTDLIPDFIIGLGYVDDAAVISFLAQSIKTDLETFIEWETRLGQSMN